VTDGHSAWIAAWRHWEAVVGGDESGECDVSEEIEVMRVGKRAGGMVFLPAKLGTCAMCATEHAAEDGHNYQSLFYQMRFKAKWGRDATHDDTVAHLPPEEREAWKAASDECGVRWKCHAEPRREPYAESAGGK
jgi:hypothetical protein